MSAAKRKRETVALPSRTFEQMLPRTAATLKRMLEEAPEIDKRLNRLSRKRGKR